MSATLAAFLLLASAPAPEQGPADPPALETTVGMPARVEELVLPGTELEAVPTDATSPIALRLLSASPHGDALRYDLEVYALDPGEYDLRDWLRRRDGTSTDDLPALRLRVSSVLPEGRVRPNTPGKGRVPPFGGYRALLIAAGVVWLAGLVWIVVGGRRRAAAEVERARPRTLAERLRPLVERALAGELSRGERARLELSLVAFWRRKLGHEERRPEEVLPLLRGHPEAGPLLASLEDWLHRPTPPREVDLAALLAPYRDLPADALDEALREASTPGAATGAS